MAAGFMPEGANCARDFFAAFFGKGQIDREGVQNGTEGRYYLTFSRFERASLAMAAFSSEEESRHFGGN